MGIPYELIGIGLGFLLGVWAFIVADTIKSRVIIATPLVVVFILPVVWRSRASSLVSFICWIIYGIGCLIYLKLQGVGLR